MNLSTALPYYFSSVRTLLFHSNAFICPLLFLQKPILIRIDNGMRFYVSNLMDIWTLKEVIMDKQYERFITLPTNGLIIDIGGAIGEFALYAAKNGNRVYAYEIDDERTKLFLKNKKINKLVGVSLHHMKASSLDAIFKENSIKKCDLLKIDCEGDEYPIFKNSSDQTLQKIESITMEYHLHNHLMKKEFKNLVQRLKKYYKIYHFPNQVHEYIGYLACQKK